MKLAEYQDLYYVKKVDFGVYLAEDMGGETHVLLPSKQVPEDAKPGEKIRVFLYKDSKDRLIATTNTPKLTLGEYAPLVVKEVGKIGAFLDWGLEKDLFLPYKEMTSRVEAGDEILVTLYIDNFGAFVAVDDRFSARIPNSEDHSFLKIGDVIEAKVTAVKPDGKLDLTLREKAYIQMDTDAEKILELLDSYAGVLPFSEKASPEVIKRETGLSKPRLNVPSDTYIKEEKLHWMVEKSARVSYNAGKGKRRNIK